MLKNILITLALVFGLVACETIKPIINSVAEISLDRAQTISSALSLRDSYIQLKDQVIANADAFSEEELELLNVEANQAEVFYAKTLEIFESETTSEVLINVNDFLDIVHIIRGSVDSAITVLEPKIGELDTEGNLAIATFISDYRKATEQMDRYVENSQRTEAAKMGVNLLRAAIPVIVGLIE